MDRRPRLYSTVDITSIIYALVKMECLLCLGTDWWWSMDVDLGVGEICVLHAAHIQSTVDIQSLSTERDVGQYKIV